jgi:predicted RND superfamily exporter protein
VAVAASGITAVAGFATLALAAPLQSIFGGDPIRMLTDFGLVGVFNLGVALAGVFLVLPAALVWAEDGMDRIPDPLSRLRRRSRAAPAAGGSGDGA